MDSEERFVNIELKLVHQEDLVEALNERVYEQQKQIDMLEDLVRALAERVRSSTLSNQTPINEPPPHY